MKRKKLFLYIVIFGMLLPDSIVAGSMVSLHDYALPNNAIRAKLNSLFQAHPQKTTACTYDKTWIDFGSWHWSVGQLATEDDTKFVVKAAKFDADKVITTAQYPGITQIHTPHQNMSRLTRSRQAQDIIMQHHLSNIKVPACWAYPISGNDTDLLQQDITDHHVVIVEEMIKKKNDSMQWCPHVADYVQKDVLQLDKETFHQLVTFAQRGNFLDLTPKNLLIDETGKLVVIDLEDTFLHSQKIVENAPPFIRSLKRFKLQCRQEGAAMYGVGLTGISNRESHIKRKGQSLITKGKCTLLIKRNIFEIVAIALVLCGAFIMMICCLPRRHRINTRIKQCRKEIKRRIKRYEKEGCLLLADKYQNIAQQVVTTIMPTEHRETIYDAFATIAIAERIKKKQPVTILARDYSSPYHAKIKSIQRIKYGWRTYGATFVDDITFIPDKKIGVKIAW